MTFRIEQRRSMTEAATLQRRQSSGDSPSAHGYKGLNMNHGFIKKIIENQIIR